MMTCVRRSSNFNALVPRFRRHIGGPFPGRNYAMLLQIVAELKGAKDGQIALSGKLSEQIATMKQAMNHRDDDNQKLKEGILTFTRESDQGIEQLKVDIRGMGTQLEEG